MKIRVAKIEAEQSDEEEKEENLKIVLKQIDQIDPLVFT